MPSSDLSVTVSVRYQPEHSEPEQEQYHFSYTIRIVNLGDRLVQLIARHWIIENQYGVQERVRGLGAVGKQPVLGPGESFEYTSYCHLGTPMGSMQGHYLFVTSEGDTFECPIPRFALDSSGADKWASALPLSMQSMAVH